MSHRRAKKVRKLLKDQFENYTKRFYRFCKRHTRSIPGWK